jgi:hypothetical protein
MRAFFIKISKEPFRRDALHREWIRRGGIVVHTFNRTVRYVFTDAPLIWKLPEWLSVWSASGIPENSFHMVPAQWIFTCHDILTHCTIPNWTIKREFDKALVLPPILTTETTETSVEVKREKEKEKEHEHVVCQYPGCTKHVIRLQYDQHLLAHLQADQLVNVPDWWDISRRHQAQIKLKKEKEKVHA